MCSLACLPQQTGSCPCCWDPGPAEEPDPTGSGDLGSLLELSGFKQNKRELETENGLTMRYSPRVKLMLQALCHRYPPPVLVSLQILDMIKTPNQKELGWYVKLKLNREQYFAKLSISLH